MRVFYGYFLVCGLCLSVLRVPGDYLPHLHSLGPTKDSVSMPFESVASLLKLRWRVSLARDPIATGATPQCDVRACPICLP